MQQFNESLKTTLAIGKSSGDRTGVGTVRRFGDMVRYNLLEGFPLYGGKYTSMWNIGHELLWFLKGSDDIGYLKNNNVGIWDEWVDPKQARVRLMTVAEVIRQSELRIEGWSMVAALESLEQVFRDHFMRQPIYVTRFSEVHCSPTHREVLLGNALSGDEQADLREKLESLFTHLLCVDNDILLLRGNFYHYDHYEDWMKKVHACNGPTGLWPVVLVGGPVGPNYPIQWRHWAVRNSFASQKAVFNDFVEHLFTGLTANELADAWRSHLDLLDSGVKGIDQIAQLIQTLKTNPESRRLLVSAWNVSELDLMQLPPCHFAFQCFSEELTEQERYDAARYHFVDFYEDWQSECYHAPQEGYEANLTQFMDNYKIPKRGLSLMFYMRSNDQALGAAYNIASYALLCHMLAQVTDHMPLEIIHVGGDVHIYKNHVDAMVKIINEDPGAKLPRLKLNPRIKDIDDFKIEDIEIVGYGNPPRVSLKVAV